MQHLPPLEVARRALRASICPACYQRPPRSETLPPAFARSCEPRCALFEQIAALQAIAQGTEANSSPVHLDVIIRNDVCNKRCTHATAGDYCGERINATCALSRFAPQAIAVLQVLAEAATHAKQVTRAAARMPAVPVRG